MLNDKGGLFSYGVICTSESNLYSWLHFYYCELLLLENAKGELKVDSKQIGYRFVQGGKVGNSAKPATWYLFSQRFKLF